MEVLAAAPRYDDVATTEWTWNGQSWLFPSTQSIDTVATDSVKAREYKRVLFGHLLHTYRTTVWIVVKYAVEVCYLSVLGVRYHSHCLVAVNKNELCNVLMG